jgi:hypothetical protein
MTTTLAHAIKVLEKRTGEDRALAEAVVFMAEEADGPDDPFGNVPEGALGMARLVNDRRLRQRREAAASAALDTPAVVALLRSISDRKGVDRRRKRGRLLGWRVGTRTLHPAWQFDPRRGETRPGLDLVLDALFEVCPDPEAADALMREARGDLGGRSLADLFAAGRVETVSRLIRAAMDQS